MKISTVRSLLILLDVALVAGIGAIVYRGLQDKDKAQKEIRSYRQGFQARLADVLPEDVKQGTKSQLLNLASANLSDRAPKKKVEVVKGPVDTTPTKPKRPPLEGKITIVGTEVHTNTVAPSFALYTLGGKPSGGATASAAPDRSSAASRGRANRNAGRKPPTMSGSSSSGAEGPPVTKVEEGGAIEFPGGYLAIVKKVTQGTVLFQWGDEEVSLRVEEKDAGGDKPRFGGPPKPSASSDRPANPDTRTWFDWNPNTAPSKIGITPEGVRAIQQKGDKILEGVRFGSDRLPNGKKGLKIVEVPKNSALARAGVNSGDAFESINGKPISTKSQAIAYAKANPGLPSYTVKFWRKGILMTRTVRPPKR